MALKDELDLIAGNAIKEEKEMFTDEDVYQMLLNTLYKRIVNSIKDEVSKGNYNIEKEIQLSSGMSIDYDTSAKIPPNCSVCKAWAAYECDEDTIMFNDLYELKEGFFTKDRVVLTPLGGRVYGDIKKLAQKDGITISEPLEKITGGKAYGKGHTVGAMYIKYSYQYK